MKRSCCEERQKRGNLLLAAIVVVEKTELKLTPGRIQLLRFTMLLIAMVSYSKLKFSKVIGSENEHKGMYFSVLRRIPALFRPSQPPIERLLDALWT
jgi:hypothetical protein